jgi:1,2-diacylglycerol 3-alpha-glucosyltransferase
MNILMMTNTYLPHVGGVARSVHTFTESYREAGHKTVVVAPTFPDVEDMDPEVEKDVVRVPAVQRFNGSDFSVRVPLVSMLNPRLLEFDADIIHSHHPFLLGDTALRLGADKQVPVIFTHHTLYEEYVHYVPFSSATMRHFVIELSTHYANLCDAVIAPSQSIANLIRERGVRVPISVIPTGIAVERFASGDGGRFRAAHGLSPDQFVVGTLGRLAPEKNLAFLSRAVGRFLQEAPDAVFLVVGSGPSSDQMQEIFAELGLGERLLLAGKKTGQDLYDAYCAMDLFGFSSFSETQGLVLAEAMAAGLPVVALDASGVREVVRDGINGFMLPSDTEEGVFAEKLHQIFRDRALWEMFRSGAFKTAREFSRESCAAKALELYEQTIRQMRPAEKPDEFEELWNTLLKRLRIEWELFSEKAESAIGALLSEEENPDERPDRRL